MRQYKKMEAGSNKKAETLQQIRNTLLHRKHLDGSINFIGLVLFGPAKGLYILESVRGRGLPLVDDWDCLKSMVRFSLKPLTYFSLFPRNSTDVNLNAGFLYS